MHFSKKNRGLKKADFVKRQKMVSSVEVLYSDPFFGPYNKMHQMLEEFKISSDLHLSTIICVKMTTSGSECSEPEVFDINFSCFADMERDFKMVFQLYSGKDVLVFMKMYAR